MAKAAKKTAPKKTALKKTPAKKKAVTEKKEITIKYSDKSAGQPKLVPIFKTLASLMEPFQKGSLEKKGGKDGQVSLVSREPVEIADKKIDDLFLAGALVQKGYVGFYYYPIYLEPAFKSELKPELLKCLKGKTCFHIKKMDDQLAGQIKEALQKGYELFKKKGWIR